MTQKFKSGERVKHATKTDWGLGEVLSDDNGARVRVFFEDIGVKEFDLDIAKFTEVFGEEAHSDYLTALVKNIKSETNKLDQAGKPKSAFIPFPKAVQNFLSYFPNGFHDLKYSGDTNTGERLYKEKAHKLMGELLGYEQFNQLLLQGQYEEIVNHAKSVMNKTNLIHHYEKIWFSNGLATRDHQKRFAESLFDLLYGGGDIQGRFDQFCIMLYAINAAKGPIATYFLFIAFPDKHMFLKPEVTKHAAHILGMEINYKPELNWHTYSQVLELAERIRTKLREDGRAFLVPKDMIDVQSFIWVIAPGYFV